VRGINDREFHRFDPRAFGPGGENDPLIWGQVEIPTSITLKVLHDIIQIALAEASKAAWAIKEAHAENSYFTAVLITPQRRIGRNPRPQFDRRKAFLRSLGDQSIHRDGKSDVKHSCGFPRYVASRALQICACTHE
jgi:hypothetical protein